jgi:hypothetical protein
VVTSSILKIYRLSLSEMFIEVGLRTCIHRRVFVRVYERLRLYCVSKKLATLRSFLPCSTCSLMERSNKNQIPPA